MSFAVRRLFQSSLTMVPNLTITPPIRLINRSLIVLSGNGGRNVVSSYKCSCGCDGRNHYHTKGDKEFLAFLDGEISMERENYHAIPKTVSDFAIKTSEAEVTLTKRFEGKEEISISMNINHSVVASESEQEQEHINCKPNFEVDIKSGSKTLSFTCEFTEHQHEDGTEESNDGVFGISELTIYEGEFDEDKTYCLSADIMDPMMYDLLINMLHERGIDDGLAEKLSDLATGHDHICYVKLLENLRTFIKK